MNSTEQIVKALNKIARALDGLKEHKPIQMNEARLMTLAEVYRERGLFWLEVNEAYTRDHKPKLCKAVFLGEDGDRTMKFFCQGMPPPDRESHTFAGYYGICCRCWTKEPTSEQRKAAAWDA